MKFKHVASVLVAVTVAGVIATTSCASAESTGSTGSTGTASTISGTSNIMLYSINSDGPDFQAIVTGAVGDYGPAVTVLPDGKADPQHTSEMELNLHHGTFRLNIATIAKDVTSAYRHWPSNDRTCSGSITFTAEAPIVAGSGTGAYAGITGSYTTKVTVDEVDKKPVCNGTSPFISQVILLNGAGTVSY
jgi:hypothetical protein